MSGIRSKTSISTPDDIINTPLKVFQIGNFVVFLSFYSPIIIATIITSLSFVFQNFKGLIYLGFLIACCVVRNYIYDAIGSEKLVFNKDDICTTIQFSSSKNGNASFSAFVFAFTIMYLSFPMFSNGEPNFWIFVSLLCYFFVDIIIKKNKNCITDTGDVFLNILMGLVSSSLIITCMYAGGSGKYLFFNEISNKKDVCYKPKEQNFRCKVFKDGVLVNEL